jgi:hypothetical protein
VQTRNYIALSRPEQFFREMRNAQSSILVVTISFGLVIVRAETSHAVTAS